MSEMTAFMDVAASSARGAGALILDNLGKLKDADVGSKQASSDFVTRVDRESEALIVGAIKSVFSSHKFLAEESLRAEPGGYRWIIDPLDGTTNFIHGYPAFAVSIALELDGEIIVAVVFDPLRDEMFQAIKGQGAWLNGTSRLEVSAIDAHARFLITTGFPFKQKHMLDKYLELFSAIFKDVSGIRRAGAAALDFAHLASGRCDGFFELGLAPWDIAAGSLLIKEAGGIITDFSGGGDYLETGNVLAGNSVSHPFILDRARAVFDGIINK